MLCRALPRTLALGGARSPALLSLATARKEARVGHRKPQVCPGSARLPSHRCLSSGLCVGCRDPGGYANDPQVKEWMKELQQDFHHQPQESSVGVKTEAGKESQEEDVVDDKTDEGKKRQDKSKGTGVWSQLVADKYQRLESHTQIIYDYDEEILRRDAGLVEEKVKPEKIKLQREDRVFYDVRIFSQDHAAPRVSSVTLTIEDQVIAAHECS
ncbi:hypothetical protein GWK47_046462 [Chionoecetes opilio]|uniref:Uncharacterized protein n=1 Tax=Chionoecetes opilio TaxID=41210 RepID=A0A8J4YD02_CHIOP|nr:hypothetical protein GWK47_046462 [Chionoecetes opilio]